MARAAPAPKASASITTLAPAIVSALTLTLICGLKLMVASEPWAPPKNVPTDPCASAVEMSSLAAPKKPATFSVEGVEKP